jgi:hypothetical protein
MLSRQFNEASSISGVNSQAACAYAASSIAPAVYECLSDATAPELSLTPEFYNNESPSSSTQLHKNKLF